MENIKFIYAREILDSRATPTVEVDVVLESGIMGRASVPSGASTGINEALELRDNDSRYMGRGVQKAIKNVNEIIAPKLIGMDVSKQREIDELMLELDGTKNKSNLGANAILGVSMAVLKAYAKSLNKEVYEVLEDEKSIPVPMMNILNGGMHADNCLDFQEFMIIPNAKDIVKNLRIGAEVFHNLKGILKSQGHVTAVGDEGGFAPNLSSNREALDTIIEAIKKAGYTPGIDVNLALDVAASSFYNAETNDYSIEGKNVKASELIEYYKQLITDYPIISIEDALDENDWENFITLTKEIGDKVQLVGDDLFVTNKELLQKGLDKNVCNAILIKLNQIGTISETLDTIKLAKDNGYNTIISHRSGETEDTIIADLAVGLNLKQIKTGSLSRTERCAKYNQLIRINEKM